MARRQGSGDRTAEKRRRLLEGFLLPDGLYTTGFLLGCGLGESSLRAGRRSGQLKPVYRGSCAYYRGAELIGWILSTGTEARPRQLVDGTLREAVEA